MAYLGGESSGHASATVPEGGRDDFWTFEAVRERLIDALMLWRRSPGGGKWPFAKDAPWHLMTRRTRLSAADYKQGRELQLHLQAEDAEEAKRWEGRERRGGLSRDEVERRDEATEWLTWMAEDARRVVILALTQLAQGREAIDWARVKSALGSEIGNKGVYRRYSRAIAGIAGRLNSALCGTGSKNGGFLSGNRVKMQYSEGSK